MLEKFALAMRDVRANPRYLGRLRPHTAFGARAYYDLMKTVHAGEHGVRKRAAERLAQGLEQRIAPEEGYLVRDLGDAPPVQAAMAVCDRVRARSDFEREAGKSKKSFLRSLEFDLADNDARPIFDLACHPLLLGPVADYLGAVPVLLRAAVSYSPNLAFVGGSQKYHLDGEDHRQIKCFIFIEPIDEETGPLTLIPAAQTKQICRTLRCQGRLRHRMEEQDDETIYGAGGWDADRSSLAIPLCGPRGRVVVVDTCNCYHYGSRPGRKSRYVLYFGAVRNRCGGGAPGTRPWPLPRPHLAGPRQT
jgi:hypothetical protein